MPRSNVRPKWAARMRRIGPGMYADGQGGVHISEVEILDSLGVARTPQAAWMVHEICVALTAAMKVQLVEREDDDGD